MIPGNKAVYAFVLCLYYISSANAQDAKGGASFSRFRENISSFRRQQQPQLQRQQVINEEEITRNTVTQINRPTIINQQQETFSKQVESTDSFQQQSADSEPASIGSVQGTAGVDYPAYTTIPNTQFSCEQVPFDPGMYADESTGCQVYHLCYQGRRESFLCGVGTIFNQAILNCDFWYSVDCSKSSQYYQLNADFGKSSSEPGASGSFSSSSSSSLSSSKTSFVQPLPVSVQTSNVIDVQRTSSQISRPIPVQLPKVSSSFTSEFSSTSIGGKISPPKVSSTSSSSSLQQSSFATGGKTSLPKWQQQGLLSPGRRRPSYQNQQVNGAQFASESSNMAKFTANSSTNLIDDQPASKTNFASQASNSGQSPGSKGQPEQQATSGPQQTDTWKPYFKNKSPKVIGSSATSSAAPQQPTTATPPTAGTPPDEVSPATQVSANQEPTFSANGNSPAPPADVTSPSSDEVPQVPKSGPPPTEAPPQQEPPSMPASSEAPAEATPASPAPEMNPTTTASDSSSSAVTEANGDTSSGPSAGSSEEPQPTTSSSPPAHPTTTTTASQVETSSTTGEPESGGEAGGDNPAGENNSSRSRKKKKKRRDSNALTSSWVEYANQH